MLSGWVLNAVGSLGAVLILFGFYRTSIGRWTHKSFWYELDNLVGAGLLMIYNLSRKSYISVILDIIWIIVAMRGISSISERYKAAAKRKKS